MPKIIPFSAQNAHFVKTLNVEWLQKYFYVEPIDEQILGDPQTEIIDKGGFVFFAQAENQVVGTVSLLKIDETTYELSKMAVTAAFQGQGISNMLMSYCIAFAKIQAATKLILYSNTLLEPAIKLYLKFGFVEIPVENSHYVRSNIKMQLFL